ncbi:cholesterol 25-hydroxylase [Elysia marginata]|uniref:Cholesterol 25-hydroxylase n=1 Tax=Elysia marginata TaxID=1093978 RepID=A0AAV4H398_9GAST|nr:cholesterol 25-hydroxylase [Elysia marginata]
MAPSTFEDWQIRTSCCRDDIIDATSTKQRGGNPLRPPQNSEPQLSNRKPAVSRNETAGSLAENYRKETQIARLVAFILVCASFYFRNSFQMCIDILWEHLRLQPYFCSAYFESVYVTVVYGLIIVLYPYAMHYISYLSRFKVKDDVTYVHQTVLGILKDAVVYLAPLFFADSIIQKKYSGVPVDEWAIRSKQWIQTTRALPVESPNFLTMCFHVFGSVIVFDALFFVVHFTLHKNAFLYRHVHALHHRHGAMHAHVTNQLTVVERGAIVVAANYSLKLFSAHPLTRLVFVVVFLWMLVDNHTGYDMPWSPHRLAPAGLMGGPAAHHAHHVNGAKHYQPFFTYLDTCLERWDARKSVGISKGK